ncbi:hypothetical protein LR48_Vigan07g152800 [Vigna angularis]|uniref:Uncharacterized protein n=1 Tax=Phaseolus angularis TaxID=3914 RepID=A0A0L9UZ41_PHAAN|nr:hypothetical protein LR48_Vigan07g152800 [Vigna angularis]
MKNGGRIDLAMAVIVWILAVVMETRHWFEEDGGKREFRERLGFTVWFFWVQVVAILEFGDGGATLGFAVVVRLRSGKVHGGGVSLSGATIRLVAEQRGMADGDGEVAARWWQSDDGGGAVIVGAKCGNFAAAGGTVVTAARVRYRDTIVVDQGRSSMYGFFEPKTIQGSGNTLESKQYYLQSWMAESNRDVYLVPYIDGKMKNDLRSMLQGGLALTPGSPFLGVLNVGVSHPCLRALFWGLQHPFRDAERQASSTISRLGVLPGVLSATSLASSPRRPKWGC